MYESNKSVKEAALLLDKIKPEWYELVNMSILDMNEPKLCILGQAFQMDFNLAYKILYPNKWDVEYCEPPFGYMTDVYLWQDEINIRLNKRESV